MASVSKTNPYVISFGRIPSHYIERSLIIDEILDSINSDIIQSQAYKITGIRGTGKTVTLSAIERKLRDDKNWIVIGVKPESNILEDIIGNIYNDVPYLSSFFKTSLNLSKFGIGVNIEHVNPVTSLDSALKKILVELNRLGKRLLITIDEVKNTPYIRDFIQEFQILIRQDLPIFLIIAGLYNDVADLENADHLTFFLRAEKYEMKPLNLTMIRKDYMNTLRVSFDVADQMALLTNGYAFAYQALGKYMWDLKAKEITEDVLVHFDEALSEKVYQKIWSELTPKERWFLSFIVQKDQMPVSELLEITGQKKNQFSKPRDVLKKKGIIDTSTRGVVSVRLPRFKEFVESQKDME